MKIISGCQSFFLPPPVASRWETPLGSPAAQHSLSRSSGTVLEARDSCRVRGRTQVPFFGHLQIAPHNLGPGAPQSCLCFSPEGLPGFRPLAPGDNWPGPPRQFEAIALAQQRLPAPPEDPAHHGGKAADPPRSRRAEFAPPHIPDPGRGSGRIQGPSPVQRSPTGIISPGDGTLVSKN
ncbi:hypothetical protein NDU88_002691 [Pleurodeles waltl]|uniref:Uncharacterized protein n=1 Tax=Pleurodeles waltl TaxID=8319 RepID=A0AAV7TLU3_PLEWA|nr:hypothetical protein NDU88_002691 [Pleurodeles waltl]